MYFFVPCLLRDSENEEYVVFVSRNCRLHRKLKGTVLPSRQMYSPVNLSIFEAQHQTNCNRIVFNAI